MAKKKPESAPGKGLIITLVFFVIATLALGTTTYLFYADIAKEKATAAKATTDVTNLTKNVAEETARRNVLRIALGIEQPKDREDLSGASRDHSASISDEYKKIVEGLGAAGAPVKDAFAWLLEAGANGNMPAPAPKNTVTAIAKLWAGLYRDADQRYKSEVLARKKAEDQKADAELRLKTEKDNFDKKIADLGKNYADQLAANAANFINLKKSSDDTAGGFKKATDEYADALAKKDEEIVKLRNDVEAARQKVARLSSPDTSSLEAKLKGFDLTKVDERKGQVISKEAGFVTIKFDARLNLVPGQGFVVIPPTASLVEVIDREIAIDKRHREHVGSNREPFSDNELIKGMIEITEVTSPYTARARVIHEVQTIRNPISSKDQLFNVALSSLGQEHVAFCGNVDLDGDGRDDNPEFIRILEKNNVVIDQYLDVKSGELKGRGMSLKTKFLIVGTDAPSVGKIADMRAKARELSIQQIDARKFLILIGVKPPKNPAAAQYGNLNLGGDTPAPAAPVAPGAEPKKEPM